MQDFSGRTKQAAKLETPFIKSLNEMCQTHRIANFGVENTDVQQLHQYIRFARDISSRFVRFLPDSVIVRTDDKDIGLKTALLEFKVQDTLIYSDRFFNNDIKTEYKNRIKPGDPNLTEKHQIFQVEKDALDIYNEIAKLKVEVIVIGWQTPTDKLIAQYANKIVVCHEWNPSPSKRKEGSGTVIANTHIGSYEPLEVFCSRVFGIQDDVLNAITQSIRDQ